MFEKNIQGIKKSQALKNVLFNSFNSENSNLLMIKSLIIDESPIERVNYLKTSGNRAYKLGPSRWNDAIIYYNQALEVNCGDPIVDSLIYANRAQIQMQKKEYIYCLFDCQKSLELNPRYIKSYYRAAKASKALNKFKQARNFCLKGLKLNSGSEKYFELLLSMKKTLKHQKQKICKNKIMNQRKTKDKKERDLTKVLTLNNFIFINGLYKIQSYEYPCKIWINEKFILFFPVIFLYPEFGQSDVIRSCDQHSRFADHLCQMFPPQVSSPKWDKEKKYQIHNLLIYFESKNGKFINVDPKKTFTSILSIENYQIPKIPVFYVIHPNFLMRFQNNVRFL